MLLPNVMLGLWSWGSVTVKPRVVSVITYVSVTVFDDVTEMVAFPFCAVTVTGGELPLIFVPESTLDVVIVSVSLTGAKL